MQRIEPKSVCNLGGSFSVIDLIISKRLSPSNGFFKVNNSYKTHEADHTSVFNEYSFLSNISGLV